MKKAVSLSPRDARLRIYAGSFYADHGKYAEAEVEFRAALQLDPNNHSAMNSLGYYLAEQNKNLEEALKLVQRSLEGSPNNGYYLDSLGWVYFKLGILEEAERCLKLSIDANIPSAVPLEHLGDVYHKQGKSDLAKEVWQKALSLSDDPKQREQIKVKLKDEPKVKGNKQKLGGGSNLD
jgi:Flp pilus assembly protein TadD